MNSTDTSKKRLDYLDIAKGIGMVLVLMGHLQGDAIFSLSPVFHPICVFIFSFHMPMFFIISGILINHTYNEDISLKDHAKKRFKFIMIPYFCFSVCYLSVVVYALIKGSIMPETLFVNLTYVISLYGMNVLWFLPALFLGELLFLALKKKLSSKVLPIVIIVLNVFGFALSKYVNTLSNEIPLYKKVSVIFTVLTRPLLVCGFIAIGYAVHEFVKNNKKFKAIEESIESSIVKSRIIYILLGLILLGVCAFFSKVNNGIDFRSLKFGNIFFFFLCALSGSYGLILFCKGLPKIRLLSFWGKGSLIFMAVHNSETVLFYALKASMYANKFLTHARGYICYAIILGIILIYTSVMILLIENCFPFILGKGLPKFIKSKNSSK